MSRIAAVSPDILFLDLMLPGISGIEMLQSLEQHQGGDEMTIFVMTAKDLTKEEDDYLRRRVQMVLRKGMTPLPKIIETFIERITALQEAA